MRIVLFNDDCLPNAHGGAAVVVDRLRRGFASRGHEVTLVTTTKFRSRGSACPEPSRRVTPASQDEIGNTITIETESLNSYQRHRLCVRNPKMRHRFDEIFANLKPDIVHAHNVHEHLSYECLRAAHAANAKTFLAAHDTFLVSFGRVRDVRKLNWLDHFKAVGRGFNPRRNAEIRRMLNETGTQVIAISNVLKEFLELNGIHVAAVIHNGTEIEPQPDPAAVEGFKQKHNITDPTILFGGRISGDKGISALLKAFETVRREVPQATLAIAGDEEKAQQYARDAGAGVRPAVLILGHLQRDQMQLAYAASTVVTTPSIYLDPFNLMNIEAMAAGKPVVGTMFGGTPEIVEDGVTGFIRNPNDTASFADALIKILQNPQKAAGMGEAGRKHVEEHFTAERMVEDYLALFN